MAVDRTLWEVCAYFPRPRNAAERFSQEHARVTYRDLIMEDASTMENTQSVIASGAKTHFNFQDEEILLRHDNKILAEYMGVGNGRATVQRSGRANHVGNSAA
jgi:carnitine monooxygenase subunit